MNHRRPDYDEDLDVASALLFETQATKLRALIFDVDGTLADTEEAHRRAFNAAFRAHGLDWHWSAGQYGELLRVTGGKERIHAYIKQLALARPEHQQLIDSIAGIRATKSQSYRALVARGELPFRSGVLRLIQEAHAAGLQLAIASTTSPDNVDALLAANIGPEAIYWFDTIATGDVVKNKKPAPDIYALVLSQLGLSPAQAVAFEDSMIGVKAAKAAGLFTVAAPSSWTVEQDFAAADLALDSLGDPDRPLSARDAERVGGTFLGLRQLRALHRSSAWSQQSCVD